MAYNIPQRSPGPRLVESFSPRMYLDLGALWEFRDWGTDLRPQLWRDNNDFQESGSSSGAHWERHPVGVILSFYQTEEYTIKTVYWIDGSHDKLTF